jgi:hypothetical protein
METIKLSIMEFRYLASKSLIKFWDFVDGKGDLPQFTVEHKILGTRIFFVDYQESACFLCQQQPYDMMLSTIKKIEWYE